MSDVEWGAEALRRTSGYGHWLAGVAACAGAMAWDPSLPLVVQDDTERCVVLSTAKDLRLGALDGPAWWVVWAS